MTRAERIERRLVATMLIRRKERCRRCGCDPYPLSQVLAYVAHSIRRGFEQAEGVSRMDAIEHGITIGLLERYAALLRRDGR